MNTHQKHLLIIEDDASIREGLCEMIQADGLLATAAADGPSGLKAFESGSFDLVLLDLMLPRMSGYDVCRRIREKDRRVPVLMLTAKGEEIDKVLGLELGADDYITKPFGMRELLARIHAALRRGEYHAPEKATGAKAATEDYFTFGSAQIDRKRFTALCDGQTQELTSRELKLLEVLATHKGEVLSRDALLNEVWGINYLGTTRTLDQHIAQLRKKVESPGRHPCIKTVHGVGYQYVG